jgi:hypothetical protein
MKTGSNFIITANGLCKWAVCFLLMASAARLGAAVVIDFDALDAAQGFNFNGSVHTNIGYITALTLNGTALSADFIVKNPLNPSNTMHVVAVLDSEDWAGNSIGQIQFRARISTANRQTVSSMLHSVFSTSQIQINFQIFDYSTNYFETFNPLNDAAITALLESAGSILQISVASAANTDITSPQNYELAFTNVPPANGECLVYTTASTRTAKNFGVGAIIPVPPAVSGAGVTQITATGATLQETVNPGNGATAVYFNYGTNSSLTAPSCTITNTLGAGTSDVAMSIPISNLLAQTTYYYQVVAGNSAGTNDGAILSFTSLSPPAITSVERGGTGLTFAGTNGSPGATYYVLSSTNILMSSSNWVPVATNHFDGAGNFNLTITNAVNSTLPHRFYLIEIPPN